MNVIDRYVLTGFIATLVFSVAALCVIFLVVDLMESLDGFLDHNAPVSAIATYYVYYLPQIIKLIFPIAMLMASLFSVGRLAGNNEITAMKSSGMSVYRLLLPIAAVSLMLSGAQLYFNGWIVPHAQTKMLGVDRAYLGKAKHRTETQVFNVAFRDSPLRNVLMNSYNDESRRGVRLCVEDYADVRTPRIVRRLDAEGFCWDEERAVWIVENAYIRTVTDGDSVRTRHASTDTLRLLMPHEAIVGLQRSVDEMSLDEYKEHIDLQERGGKDVRMKRIDYFGQFAFPFANLIVVLFGVPFASVKRRGGVAGEIAAAMIVTFSYLVFTKLSQSLGFELELPAAAVGWSANIIFAAIAIANLWRVRT
ncbi:MAG: LptF/LptG family permease [Candidatus Kapaibacterium sp.]